MEIMVLSLMGSLFVSSFSSILSASILVFSTIFVLGIIYWNMISMIPLYIFSLFVLGGLFVLIGFVMMGDKHDSDMVLAGSKVGEYLVGFISFFVGLGLSSRFSFVDGLKVCFFEDSPIKLSEWSFWSSLSGTFCFLIFFLFIFLFILHSMMKGSWGGGGFVN